MRVVAAILLLTFPVQALAGPFEYSFQALPRGEKCENSDHWCYTLDEFKLLIKGDSEIITLRGEVSLLNEKLAVQVDLIKNLNEQLKLLVSTMAVLQGEVKRLSTKWAETDKALQECKYDEPLWPWLVLGGSGLLIAIAVGIVVGVYVGK